MFLYGKSTQVFFHIVTVLLCVYTGILPYCGSPTIYLHRYFSYCGSVSSHDQIFVLIILFSFLFLQSQIFYDITIFDMPSKCIVQIIKLHDMAKSFSLHIVIILVLLTIHQQTKGDSNIPVRGSDNRFEV